jgi:Ca2+-binding RTX toxin-like protein
MSRRRITTLTATVLAVCALGGSSAQASYHENMITEVHQGVGAVGDYVELQAYAPGQNLVATKYLIMYDGGNNPFTTYQIPGNVPSGANQATILVGNDVTVTGADFNAAGNLNVVNANGAACFIDTLAPLVAVDCVDWGSSVGTLPSPVGTPLALPGNAIPDNGSISRSIARGCATSLDKADDTNDSTADFALAAPSPRGNSVAPTEVVCAPCRNKTPTVFGTAGNDKLTGTKGADIIAGYAGKDKIKGLGGKDTVCGGLGKDTISGGGGKDKLFGDAGKDKITGGGGNDKIVGGAGKDKTTQ